MEPVAQRPGMPNEEYAKLMKESGASGPDRLGMPAEEFKDITMQTQK